MKTSKTSAKSRVRSTKAVAKVDKHRSRPIHKRILLHPFSVMVLLCTGVIVLGSTFQGSAASYDVTASVPAVPVTAPAVITLPYDQQHVTTSTMAVVGTCPPASYVKLYRNAAFSGTSMCTSNSFAIQTALTSGGNQLEAKVYNLTNDEGPQSSPVTVHYDATTVTSISPPAVPEDLKFATMENGGGDPWKTPPVTSTHPTVTGFAPPFADVVVTFHSDPVVCKTRADSVGWWTCTLDSPLPPGVHQVDIEATSMGGKRFVLPTFQIKVMSSVPTLRKQASPANLLITSEYKFQTHYVGQPFRWSFGLAGGTAPYTVTVDWGDDSHSSWTRNNTSSFNVEHAYPDAKTYTVLVKATDAKGASTTLQLSAVVKGQTIGVASLTTSGPLASIFSNVRQYLWIVWPVYLGVVLMAVSYWLGEQEVYQRLRQRRVASGRR